MNLDHRLEKLEQSAGAGIRERAFVRVNTVLGQLRNPVESLPTIEKVYGRAPENESH
jgi:hypothetical protein